MIYYIEGFKLTSNNNIIGDDVFLPFLEFQTMLPLDVELGLFAGLAVAFSGYLKVLAIADKDGKREGFDFQRFFTTILIGAVVGGGVSYVQMFDSAVTLFLATAGLTVIIDDLVKAFLRQQKIVTT